MNVLRKYLAVFLVEFLDPEFLSGLADRLKSVVWTLVGEYGVNGAVWGKDSREWVYYANLAVLLPVVEIFGIDNPGSQCLRGSENRRVPIRNRKALRERDGYLYQLAVYGLAWKCRPLLNPLQGLGGGERTRRFPNDRHKKLLQDLSRRAEVLRLDQVEGAFPLGLVLACPNRRINQNVSIEEDLSVHADLPGSRTSRLAALGTACSIAAAGLERGGHGRDVRRDSSSTHAPTR